MKLAFNLQAAEAVTESIDTKATVLFENGTIGTIQLESNVKASGITKEKFDELVADAKANCPVSKLLNAEITLQAHLL
jgi:osmotically inducible protein OsmC